MELQVLSYTPLEFEYLSPAPSITTLDRISDTLNEDKSKPITNLTAAPIKILTNYRGHMLYCQGGVTVHRYAAEGINEYAISPIAGEEEDVIINGQFKARVKYM